MNRKQVFDICMQQLEEHIAELESGLQEMSESMVGESKSSAGDKHETSRAMLHLEQEKLSRQLEEVQLQKVHLHQCEHFSPAGIIEKGALVETDKTIIYLTIPLGKVKVGAKEVMVISPASPLGLQLLKKKEKDQVTINGNTFLIVSIS